MQHARSDTGAPSLGQTVGVGHRAAHFSVAGAKSRSDEQRQQTIARIAGDGRQIMCQHAFFEGFLRRGRCCIGGLAAMQQGGCFICQYFFGFIDLGSCQLFQLCDFRDRQRREQPQKPADVII